MTTLIAVGQIYDRMVTVGGYTTSSDGYAWTTSANVTEPFLPMQAAIGIAAVTLPPADITWVPVYNVSTYQLNVIEWLGPQFLAVGANGTIVGTDNGIDWYTRLSNTSANLNGIAWSGTVYVAVGDGGALIYSYDGQDWVVGNSGTANQLLSVTWASEIGMFVAVGASYTILTSLDGVAWASQTSGSGVSLTAITWTGLQFVAVGASGRIQTSTDGMHWTIATSNATSALNDITWNGSLLVAVGANGVIVYSADGITWKVAISGITTNLNRAVWSQSEFAAVGDSGVIIKSKDGAVWSANASGVTTELLGVGWSPGIEMFVAVGSAGTVIRSPIYSAITAVSDDGYVSSSYDGSLWYNGSIIDGNLGPRAVRWGVNSVGNNSTYILVGSQKYATNEASHAEFDEVAQIFTSPEGFEDSWTMVYAEDSTDSRYHGVRRISPLPASDSANPTQPGYVVNTVIIDQASNPYLSGLVSLIQTRTGVGTYNVVFDSEPGVSYDIVAVTDDGIVWTFTFSGSASFSTSNTATFSWEYPDAWVVCGVADGNPVLLYSLDDGATWDRVSLPSAFNGRALFDIVYANDQFYISAYGVVLYASSLINPVWDATDFVTASYASPDFTQIAANPSGHVVAVASGLIYYTTDGASWNRFEYPGYQFTSVVWYIDHWVVGVRSLMTTYTYFTSTDTKTWVGQNNGIQMYDFAILP